MNLRSHPIYRNRAQSAESKHICKGDTMNLTPVNPPMREGQTIQCCLCLQMRSVVLADLDAKPGTFVCRGCALYYVSRKAGA